MGLKNSWGGGVSIKESLVALISWDGLGISAAGCCALAL